MIELPITPEQVIEAKELAKIDDSYGSWGYSNNQNKTGKRAGVNGSLGEIVFRDYTGCKLHEYEKEGDVYHYDLVWKDIKYDVKTMTVFQKPPDTRDACTTAYWDQKPEGLIFVYVMGDYTKAWIGGHLLYNEFYKKAVHIKAGHVRNDGFKYKWDNYVCKISDLKEIDINMSSLSDYV